MPVPVLYSRLHTAVALTGVRVLWNGLGSGTIEAVALNCRLPSWCTSASACCHSCEETLYVISRPVADRMEGLKRPYSAAHVRIHTMSERPCTGRTLAFHTC